MKLSLLAFALLLVAESASAQSMNAEEFHQRASALQRKGFMALFSGDMKVLMNEGKAAGAKAREQRLADAAAGRKPRYCPPPGQVSIDSNEFIKRLSVIPAADRQRIDMTEATIRILASKFPCPA